MRFYCLCECCLSCLNICENHKVIMECKDIILFLLASCLVIASVDSSRILFLPFDHYNHVNLHAKFGEKLISEGHYVTILTAPRMKRILGKYSKIECWYYNFASYWEQDNMEDKMTEVAFDMGLLDKLKAMKGVKEKTYADQERLLADEEMTVRIAHAKFDLMILDGLYMNRIQYIIPYRHDVPFITLAPIPEPWHAAIPSLPSSEVHFFFPGSDHMTFMQRISSFLCTLAFYTITPPISHSYFEELLRKYAPDKPLICVGDLHRKSEMWLVMMEHHVLEYPLLSHPAYKIIGGFAAKQVSPLTGDLSSFVGQANHGVILLTFGSGINSFPDHIMSKLMEAFSQIKQHVIMRYKGIAPSNKPSNVILMEWVPQNDILGHPNTKLFITHGGNSGQLESVAHAVPMITFPIGLDQMHNAERAKARGYGLVMDFNTFTPDELVQNINEMIDNKTYKDNLLKAQAILDDLPDPLQEIAFWVNHVLKFGGSHLKPVALNMPWYQWLMIDILLVVLLFVYILYQMIKYSCRLVWKTCSWKTKQKTD
ncbi:unnamed protein product [Owenia fusiformis]|uniref:UDP-glucuronosyltransferase n=1 Tax=Owenia fusiformis TaxID=6347 RepID=A0A8S4PEJ7_OWEFU|nr:unnamed protein product [Owenia fusiformis]